MMAIKAHISIPDWQRIVHENSKIKGFWDKSDWANDFPVKIALIHSEISEALEEYRDGITPTKIYYGRNGKPEGIPVELADAIIRIMDLAQRYQIDLEEAMLIKHRYNQTRPYMHGKKI